MPIIAPKNKNKLTIKPNPYKETITLTIKDNSILTKDFKEEGYHKSNIRKYDESLDKKSKGEIRIMRGNKPNSIKFITYITGMRTLSRLLSFNADPEQNLFLSNLGTVYAGYHIERIISFYFRVVMLHCKIKGESVIKSNYTVYSNFIANYKERTNSSRNIALNSVVAILLSKLPIEKQEKLINKYFSKSDTKQKASIRADLNILNPIVSKGNEDEHAISNLYNTLRRYYGW